MPRPSDTDEASYNLTPEEIAARGWRIEQKDGYVEIWDETQKPPVMVATGYWVIGPEDGG